MEGARAVALLGCPYAGAFARGAAEGLASGWLQWFRRPALSVAAALCLVVGIGLYQVGRFMQRGRRRHPAAAWPFHIVAPTGTAVADLQYLDKNSDLLQNFDALDDMDGDADTDSEQLASQGPEAAMRTNYIPALLVTLALAVPALGRPAPVWHAPEERACCVMPRRQRMRRSRLERLQSQRHAGRPELRARSATRVRSVRARPHPNSCGRQSPPHQIIRGQGPHNGDWLRNTMRLPPQEQQQKTRTGSALPPASATAPGAAQKPFAEFQLHAPQQQQRVLNRMEMIEHLRPEQQQAGASIVRAVPRHGPAAQGDDAPHFARRCEPCLRKPASGC